MKKIAVLGSSGSIGTSTLQVVDHLEGHFQVAAIAARQNVDAIVAQAKKYRPTLVCLFDENAAKECQKRLPEFEVVCGLEGLIACATLTDIDMVVQGMSGTQGLLPTVKAIEAKKAIALANKEVLISAGKLLVDLAKQKGVHLLPIDSEHSALFQSLVGEERECVQRFILTASGGPFFHRSYNTLQTVTVNEALAHPTWHMGAKVTVDSSTMMNKGLEVIEAHVLFDLPVDCIDVVVHPQSVVHSFVEFRDGSMKAQLSEPSMITPIQYAMTYPHRFDGLLKPFDFTKAREWTFFPPDNKKFPWLNLAYYAAKEGGTLPGFLNSANDVLVHRFLNKEIGWMEMGDKLEKLLLSHTVSKITSFDIIAAVDEEARRMAAKV